MMKNLASTFISLLITQQANAIQLTTEVKSQDTLRDVAAQAGLLFGSQFKHDLIYGTSEDSAIYRETHAREMGISVAGNVCKFGPIQRKQGVYDYSKCSESLAHAVASGQEFRGHVLIWHNMNPSWLEKGTWTYESLDAVMKDHIFTVMQGVRADNNNARVYAWDVVNEAVENNFDRTTKTWKTFMRQSLWFKTMNYDFIINAFKYARQADPEALLFYNDYHVITQ